jgi:phosphoribosylformylglycinamidine (FGAM) synthase PurS component
VGKQIRFTLKAIDLSVARQEVAAMAEQLLANTVIEQFSIDVSPAHAPSAMRSA